jgi:ketosteroid isomerase-like protein
MTIRRRLCVNKTGAGRVKMRYVPRDRTFTTDLLDAFRFKDGKIVELLEFADTALIRDLMSPV